MNPSTDNPCAILTQIKALRACGITLRFVTVEMRVTKSANVVGADESAMVGASVGCVLGDVVGSLDGSTVGD